MRNTHKTNIIFFTIAVILLLAGFIILLSASTVSGMEKFKDAWYFIKHQLKLGILVGLPGFFFFYKVDYHKFKKWAIVFFILNILALLLAFIPQFTLPRETAYRSLNLGLFSFQPSEFLKITLIMVFASLFSSHIVRGHKDFKKTVLPFLIYLSIASIILLLQPSTSIVVLLVLTGIVMYFCSSFSFAQLVSGFVGLAIVGGLIFGGLYISGFCKKTNKITGKIEDRCLGYRIRRIQAFFNPTSETLDETYQPKQAKIGLGSGGWLGVGLGQSRQKYSYLPESFTDSIFAIIGEELGFIGSMSIIVAFFLFYFFGLSIAKGAPDAFGSYLALGLITWITIQAYLHIMSASGFLPQTGVPLPFISYGGSLFIVCLWSLGILANISRQ